METKKNNKHHKDSSAVQSTIPGIQHPHEHDVLCGRAAGLKAHPGNAQWRLLVTKNKDTYTCLPKRHKLLLSRSIVLAVQRQNPPGRFLQRNSTTNLWFDIGNARAEEKTSQALRECLPLKKRREESPYGKDAQDGRDIPVQRQKRPRRPTIKTGLHCPVGFPGSPNSLQHDHASSLDPISLQDSDQWESTTSPLDHLRMDYSDQLRYQDHRATHGILRPPYAETHHLRGPPEPQQQCFQKRAALQPGIQHNASELATDRNSFSAILLDDSHNNGVMDDDLDMTGGMMSPLPLEDGPTRRRRGIYEHHASCCTEPFQHHFDNSERKDDTQWNHRKPEPCFAPGSREHDGYPEAQRPPPFPMYENP